MADYPSAITFVINLEDTHRPSGRVTQDADGFTRYGLLDRWHPDLVAQGFYTCDPGEALVIAKAYYKPAYWDKLHGDSITSNKVATQLLSIGVNDGVVAAIKIAQQVVNVKADGIMGSITVDAINAIGETSFLQNFNSAAKARYQQIAEIYPTKAGDLQGWFNRVELIDTYQG